MTTNYPQITTNAPATPAVPYLGNASFEDRMAFLKAAAKGEGFTLPSTIVPEGTTLIPYGEERQRALRAEIADLPDFTTAMNVVRAQSEQRRPVDIQARPSDLRMSPLGGLVTPLERTSLGMSYTDTGFAHLTQFIKPAHVRQGFASTLLALTPSARAVAYNDFAGRTESSPALIRIINVGNNRVVRAAASEQYTTVDDLDIVNAIESVIPAGAKARIIQTWDRTDLEIIWPALERQLKVGDIAKIVVHISNSETKAGSVRIMPKLLRVLCLNFTTAYADGLATDISIRHIGEAKAKFVAGFADALKAVEPFVQAFGDAYNVALPAQLSRGELAERLAKKYPSVTSDRLLADAVAMWDADGEKSAGDTLAGFVHALTRASQKLTMEKASAVEAVAGKLIVTGWEGLGL